MKVSDINSSEFHSYFKPYMDKVGDLPLLEALRHGKDMTCSFFNSIPLDKLEFRYAVGKWTIKDILVHIIDAERAFSYRALNFARAKDSILPGFDENIFVESAQANTRFLSTILEEYIAVRNTTILLFESFSNKDLVKTGIANQVLLSVRAAGFLICGHEIHHQQIIKERYL